MSKGASMISDMIIKKNNVLTDGNIPDRAVLSEKVANTLYCYYEKMGEEFTIAIPDLLKDLNMNHSSGNNQKRLLESLDMLMLPINVRNFNYEGKQYKLMKSHFLKEANIEEGNSNKINFIISPKLIEALKQQESFTLIDLETSNKFKTKYGITLWQMYLRYKGQERKNPYGEKYTFQEFTLNDLNKKFATNYKTPSEMRRCLSRGITEATKITDKKISVDYDKKEKLFRFVWERVLRYETNPKEFREHIRINYKNEKLLTIHYIQYSIENPKEIFYQGDLTLACDNDGKLYDLNQMITLNADESKKLWQELFEKQKQIVSIQQTTMKL